MVGFVAAGGVRCVQVRSVIGMLRQARYVQVWYDRFDCGRRGKLGTGQVGPGLVWIGEAGEVRFVAF